MHSVRTIDAVNGLLIILSGVFAYYVPFELFLFSYAVFGPLHYLTEIHWLSKHNFFVVKTKVAWVMFILTVCLTVLVYRYSHTFNAKIILIESLLLWTAFCCSFLYIRSWSTREKVIVSFLGVSIALFFLVSTGASLLFLILLPTAIHVSLFTVLFMLQGSQKSKSILGYTNIILYGGVSILLIFLAHETKDYSQVGYIKNAYSSFESVNQSLLKLFGMRDDWSIYSSSAGLASMRFVAFAYTYHYLNWFSKVNIIKWNQATKKAWTGILLVWIFSVGLYAVNYKVGLMVLYFLSILHVILEFPLNQHSILSVVSNSFLSGKNISEKSKL
jgi:hypothetical protein